MATLSRLAFPRIAFTVALLAAVAVPAIFQPSHVLAQDEPIFAPGQPIVIGFSGVVPPEAPPPGSDPLDYTFIDLDGPSMVIQQLQPDGPPSGELIPSPSVFSATAADVGQAFGVTLDDAHEMTGADAPNIYLSATSAFGLHITVPDADGNPVRSKVGAPEATFMPGQWGSAGEVDGYPGSIWKVDGETGEISLFTTIAANTGAGLGDLVYDPSSAQFFVSDLDTGLIYRLAADGIILDTFDHGVTARPEHELDPVEDDGSAMSITDPAFNSEDPATWGFTQPERKVYGLALKDGRLYYSVADALSIWSVRINADGSFGAARWELDVVDLLSANEITDILFDPLGRMILAQRGPQVGSYDYSVFATSQTSSVVRYEREFPDNPATPGTWVPEPDSYAIGFAPDGANAAGGIALGPKYDDETGAFDGACDAWLWASGDSLRDNLNIDDPLDPPNQVHGLQGNSASLVDPDNLPPELSFFADYDGNTDDDQSTAQGHVGGIAIWQECEFDAETYLPPVLPPDDYEPEDFGDDEEEDDGEENLTLEKWSSPYFCFDGGANWHCNFTIRVENTGDEPYWGPIVVDDYLPDNNPGATMDFWPQPPWHCNPTGPTAWQCVRGPVLLYPGDGVVLHQVVTLPKAMVGYCDLVNVAGLNWFWSGDDDPTDDFNVGIAGIPAPGCVPPPGGGSDLTLKKTAFPNCFDSGADWTCAYAVTVQNAGPDSFSGPITITDTLGLNTPATTFGPWACAQAGPVLTCDIIAPPVNVPPGWTSGFIVSQKVPKPAGPAVCDLENRAVISTPAGGTPTNLNAGNDNDDATASIPEPVCALVGDADIQVQKTGLGCVVFFTGYACEWQVTVTNVGTGLFAGPFSMKDTSIGAIASTLPTLYPGFCGPGTAVVECSTPFVVLAAGAGGTFTFHTFYDGGPAVCSANNNISVLAPNPGSPQNPAGNDSATVGQAMPNPACTPLLSPVLNIQKTATGCGPDDASEDWLCTFDITVLNYGLAAHPGPISVVDHNGKPTTFTGAACVPPGGAGFHTCTLPGPLNAGDNWTFEATTRVNPNSVTLADCHVINTVWISNPPSGGDPGYFSQADQKVPQLFIDLGPGPMAVYCDPPSLELTKTHLETVESGDGYDATFAVRAVSTGPDPYNGTVEVDDLLPDGTSFVSSTNWSCVPTTGNDVHCSSTHKNMPVGTYTEMTITMHIPRDVAVAAKCDIVNTVNASISAEVLHADEGVQYTASAAAELPASLCREPGQCPVNQVMPGGGCCEDGTLWNGRQCAAPRPQCPADSRLNDSGECVCDPGTAGEPGDCEPIQSTPTCPDDSRLRGGQCECLQGTEGRPGRCEPIEEEEELTCPRDSRIVDGACVCRRGTEGNPGNCRPIEEEPEELTCPSDSRIVDGECVCRRGTEGRPGRCQPIEEEPEELTCPEDSRVANGTCVCLRGTEGSPGNCRPIQQEEPEELTCPRDSRIVNGECVCRRGTEGSPGKCQPIGQNDEPVLQLDPKRPILRLPTIN